MPRTRPHDLKGIYQRPRSPFWWARWTDEHGREARRSTGVPVETDPQGLKAQAVRATWRAQGHALATGTKATVEDLLLRYLSEVTPAKRAPDRDRWSAKAVLPFFQNRQLDSVTAADVRGYIASRTAAGIAAGTVNKEVGLMSAATNWARRELEWDTPNPWGSRRLREPPGRARWLSHAEARALLDAAEARRARAPWLPSFVALTLYAGLRPGEALGLTWARVDLTARRIDFGAEDQKNGRPGAVPINDHARAALLERAAYRATWCPASPWVFCRRDGTRVASLKKAFAAAVAAAALDDVHPHDLRRTFGSWLVQAGEGIDRVSKLLRHSDISVTARVYAHLRPGDLAQTAAALDGPAGGFAHGFAHSASPETDRARKPTGSD